MSDSVSILYAPEPNDLPDVSTLDEFMAECQPLSTFVYPYTDFQTWLNRTFHLERKLASHHGLVTEFVDIVPKPDSEEDRQKGEGLLVVLHMIAPSPLKPLELSGEWNRDGSFSRAIAHQLTIRGSELKWQKRLISELGAISTRQVADWSDSSGTDESDTNPSKAEVSTGESRRKVELFKMNTFCEDSKQTLRTEIALSFPGGTVSKDWPSVSLNESHVAKGQKLKPEWQSPEPDMVTSDEESKLPVQQKVKYSSSNSKRVRWAPDVKSGSPEPRRNRRYLR